MALIRKRPRGRDEAGFTLIELMVVILIIAILMAIAIPTYLGARNRAENRAAQTTDRNALTAALANYASQGAFVVPSALTGTYSTYAAYLHHEEPAISFVPSSTGASKPGQVSIGQGANNQVIFMAAYAPDGTCWYMSYEEEPSGGFGSPGPEYSAAAGQSSCAATASPPGGASYHPSWSAATP